MTINAISLLPSSGQPPARLIAILHGWGADARDLVPIANALNLPDCQFLFPNAPFSHPQVPGGRAWYALETEDFRGLLESRQYLQDWLLSLEAQTGVPLSQTALCGFSQGGAMVLDVGIGLPVAGISSLSGFLHSKPQVSESPLPPVLMVHGRQDPVVPIQAARQARDELVALGAKVQYQELDMGHEIPPPVVGLLQDFLAGLGKLPAS